MDKPTVSLSSQLGACAMIGIFFSLILYVVFGQTTVRKLRKNPATKDKFGFEFISGWAVLNIAQTLALPRSLTKKLSSSSLSFLYGNAEYLYENTNRFDQVLAKIFYWLFMGSALSMILIVILDSTGVLPSNPA